VDNADITLGDIARGVDLTLGGDLGAGDDTLDLALPGDISDVGTVIDISFLGGDGEGDEATVDLGDNPDDIIAPDLGGFEIMPTGV
jgi:hypothetical protein